MRKGGGKQKGAEFERKVCKQLSLWISDGERQDIFWRSAMSGGRATVALKSGEKLASQAGDISAIDALGQKFIETFVVECKFYQVISFDDLIYRNKSGIPKFWNQCANDAHKHNKKPFLVVKRNNQKPLLCIGYTAKVWFFDDFREGYLRAFFPGARSWLACREGMYVYMFDDFLQQVDPARLELL
jgi:hypothetical protein